ncbi:MAG: hypothetical protein ACXV2C_05075 [Candidatus Bathyarchaeia archaeon]
MSATKMNVTPAAQLKSHKPAMSSTIQNATARLPSMAKVFGNSMVSLIFVSPSGVIVS